MKTVLDLRVAQYPQVLIIIKEIHWNKDFMCLFRNISRTSRERCIELLYKLPGRANFAHDIGSKGERLVVIIYIFSPIYLGATFKIEQK